LFQIVAQGKQSPHYEKSWENVRAFAQEAGYKTRELPYHGCNAQYCSFGGHIDIAAPPYKKWLVNQCVEASDLPYLIDLPRCPVCGQVYIGEKLVKGRMAHVEMGLEDK
jgi:hypothetical protein